MCMYLSPMPKIGETYGFFDKCTLNRYNYFDSFEVTDMVSVEDAKQMKYEDGDTLYEKWMKLKDRNEEEKTLVCGWCFEMSDNPVFLHRNRYGEWETIPYSKWPDVGVLDVDGCLYREMKINEMD